MAYARGIVRESYPMPESRFMFAPVVTDPAFVWEVLVGDSFPGAAERFGLPVSESQLTDPVTRLYRVGTLVAVLANGRLNHTLAHRGAFDEREEIELIAAAEGVMKGVLDSQGLVPAKTTERKAKTGKKAAHAYQVRVVINDVRPPIWRRLEIPAALSLEDLHEVLQVTFGWSNGHLFQFYAGNDIYDLTEDEIEEEQILPGSLLRTTTVEELLEPQGEARYLYDMGDGWEHMIQVERVIPAREAKSYAICTGGERAGPPEDCGDSAGYIDLLQAMRRRKAAGKESAFDFDPEAFDLGLVNRQLQSFDTKQHPALRGGDRRWNAFGITPRRDHW